MTDIGNKEWVDWLNTKVLQKAVVVDDVGNILSLCRISTGPAPRLDKWDLPGGCVSPQDLNNTENPIFAAIFREVLEETGLQVFKSEAIYVSSWVFERSPGKILGVAIGYKCQVRGVKPEVKLSLEHYQFQWGSKEAILALDFGDDGGLHSGIISKC